MFLSFLRNRQIAKNVLKCFWEAGANSNSVFASLLCVKSTSSYQYEETWTHFNEIVVVSKTSFERYRDLKSLNFIAEPATLH